MLNPAVMLSEKKLLEVFEKKKAAIADAFVLYYGEEHRKHIEKKLDEIEIIFYHSPQQKKNVIERYEESLRRKYAREFLSELGFEVMDIDVNKIDDAIKNTPEIARYFETCFGHPSSVWMFDRSAPMYAFDDDLSQKMLLSDKNKKRVIEYFTSQKIDSVASFSTNPRNIDFFIEIENQISLLKNLREEFLSELDANVGALKSEVKSEIEEAKKIRSEIQEELFECVNETLKFNSEYRSLVERLRENSHKPRANTNISDFICSLDDVNFKGILSFDPYYDSLVNDKNTPEIMKRNIIRERKMFLNDLGVCLPLDSPYEEFEKRANELEIVIPRDLIFVIGKIREIFAGRLTKALYENSGILKYAMRNIKNPSINNINEICSVLTGERNCVKVYTKLPKKETQTVQIYLSPFGNLHKYSDVAFVHEIAHFLQIFFEREKSASDPKFNYYRIGLLDSDSAEGEDSVELLGEYLTQKTAVDVTQILHEKLGTKIFEFEDENFLQGFCRYEIFDLLLFNFYSDFIEEIKTATITGKPEVLHDALNGKDLLDSICRITNKFADFFYNIEENGLELMGIIARAKKSNNRDLFASPEKYLSGTELDLLFNYNALNSEMDAVVDEFVSREQAQDSGQNDEVSKQD